MWRWWRSASQYATALASARQAAQQTAVSLVNGQPPDMSGFLQPMPGQEKLRLLRDAAELATDDVLLPFVNNQIRAEQQAWRNIDQYKHDQERLRSQTAAVQDAAKYCPPDVPLSANGFQDLSKCLTRNPVPFVFEWQKRIEQQPDRAQGALIDAFVRADAVWSVVKQGPGWDDTKYGTVALFMFSRESIEGREPDFAARVQRVDIFAQAQSQSVADSLLDHPKASCRNLRLIG